VVAEGGQGNRTYGTEWGTGKTVCILYSLFSQTLYTTLLNQLDKSQLLLLVCFLYLPPHLVSSAHKTETVELPKHFPY